jgi:thiol-disulfide isomerase/thioredoxin
MRAWDKYDYNDYKDLMDEGAYVLRFSSQWCKPCHKLGAYIEANEQRYPHLEFIEIDGELCPSAVALNHVESYPTTLLLIKGEERGRFEGLPKEDTLEQTLVAWNELVGAL